MERQKRREPIRANYLKAFPHHLFQEMRESQREFLEFIAENDGRATGEAATGTGKSAVGISFLTALERASQFPLFYIVPTKTLVEQLKRVFPGIAVAYGRNEHRCLYYPNENLKADEVPCLTLADCPHRVDQETGGTKEPGVTPCPYYQQKFEARRAPIVVSTMAFYLFHQLFPGNWPEPKGLVIDEAHEMARVVRNVLSYEITDYHLGRACELLERIDAEAAKKLRGFLRSMLRIIKKRPVYKPSLLDDQEIAALMEILDGIDTTKLERKLAEAVRSREIDPAEERAALRQLEVIIRNLRRYFYSLEFSLPAEKRHALNYTYAFYKEEKGENDKVQYKLVIKAHFVAPLIAKILSPRTVAYSATIGDGEIFSYETGIRAPMITIGSDFPSENARVYIPTDTLNLAVRTRKRQDVARTLRRITKAVRKFAKAGHRSLVVVISEEERRKFLALAEEECINAVSYGDGVPAKEAARRFRDGIGDVLVGTAAQYGEGIDLPGKTAPIIFMLRPGYPRPDDPATLFEERRFSQGRVWAVRNWRVMIEALQVRGRNIRSATDRGATFFVSQQFRSFIPATLPGWLRDSYRGTLTFDQCVDDTLKLLERG